MTEETTSRPQVRLTRFELATRSDRDHTPLISRLALNEITTYRWSFEEDVTAYRDAGLEAIGIWRPKLVEFGEERGVELIRESGLTVSSLSWAGGFTGTHGYSFQQSLDDARDALHLAGQLRAECLVLVSGARSGHIRGHAQRLLLDALRELGDTAAESNVRLALQPMDRRLARDWTFLSTLEETLEVIDKCRHPAVGLAFDAYHLWQEPALFERIAEAAPYTATVKLSDWQEPCSLYDRHLPGDGEIPLSEITRAFLDADYTGHFEIEVWSEKLWAGDYEDLVGTCRDRFAELCQSVVRT